ncbi:hypothetical protein H1S04_14380 [Paracoccus sp. S1E-3]|uniref:hypothetical protein n=1 Tax=Paracoccus sp. S1E-3 TaxID=2756130 RepID=UPI0015EEBB29|nr:hypothetical protein [Paracoccus sp. S1E-3]MBA4491921.1 hypothetical protein [Paracoccus sp. S1E-3]
MVAMRWSLALSGRLRSGDGAPGPARLTLFGVAPSRYNRGEFCILRLPEVT